MQPSGAGSVRNSHLLFSPVIAALLGSLLSAGFSAAQSDASESCKAAKLRATARYYACRLLADARGVRKRQPADFSACETMRAERWQRAETLWRSACFSFDDEHDVARQVAAATAAAGGALLSGPEQRRCRTKGLRAARRFGACRLAAAAEQALGTGGRDLDACATRFDTRVAELQERHAPRCPAGLEAEQLRELITENTEALQRVLCGETPPVPAPVCGDQARAGLEDCDPPASQSGEADCNDDCSRSHCGDGVLGAGESCESDGACGPGEVCSACCTCVDASRPDTMDWRMHAGVGLGETETVYDLGTSGDAQGSDLSDDVRLRLRLCAATGPGASAGGDAEVRGLDPSAGNCRCEDDARTLCTRPFAHDEACGGARCLCYAAPPEPIAISTFPVCRVRRFSRPITGTWNIDSGAGSLAFDYRELGYLGDALTAPCPTCDGDPVPNDGGRDGICTGGEHDGLDCDANGLDATYPIPDGGAYSFDCQPRISANVTGPGAPTRFVADTGPHVLEARIPCGFPAFLPLVCACGTCGGQCASDSTPCRNVTDCPLEGSDVCVIPDDEQRLACATNSDCAASPAGAGICMSTSFGLSPNRCDDRQCTNAGDGNGFCAAGPDIGGCDGALRADGSPAFQCQSNADCTVAELGLDAGACTIVRAQRCFPDPVVADGTASATDPVLASTFCIPPGANDIANDISGRPGPGRIKMALSATYRCARDPSLTYPGCE